MSTLGENIARLRREKDWTQEVLADKVCVHTRHVSRWETGRHKPPPKMQQKLAEVFQVPLEELTGPENPSGGTELDAEMLQELALLKELDPADRATVHQVIKAFATKKQMARLLSA